MDQNKVRRNMGNPAEHREKNLESYLEDKGAKVPIWGTVQGIRADEIAHMLADVVPFAGQDVVRKYVLFYLDVFFEVNAKGGGRFSEGLAVCYDCHIPVYPEDRKEIEAALPSCSGYKEKILHSVLKRIEEMPGK